jgi:hypothetical protein
MIGVAVYLAQRHAPDPAWQDGRASTYLAGPYGAKGLAETLGRVGVAVRRREHALFDLARPRAGRARELFAFLDIDIPTGAELEAVRRHVAAGGRVFVAGVTWIERCFGYRARSPEGEPWTTAGDTIAVRLPGAARDLPATRLLLDRIPVESLGTAGRAPHCEPLFATRVDTLLAARDGRPVALRLAFRGGGSATLVADVRFVTNRALKETDAGVVVIPWLLADAPARIVVDEYHHGFGESTSMWGMLMITLRWLAGRPVGWALLHLGVVGLLALAVAATRFGPVRTVIERRRRSPLEHLEALAAGLEGAGGDETAVQLIVGGLRRRLSRGGRPPAGNPRAWLEALELGVRDEQGRRAVRRLKWILTQRAGGDGVAAAAHAVEDVWESLQLPRRPA